jgi:hypothetical protein
LNRGSFDKEDMLENLIEFSSIIYYFIDYIHKYFVIFREIKNTFTRLFMNAFESCFNYLVIRHDHVDVTDYFL